MEEPTQGGNKVNVWVVHKGFHDYTKAEKYGNLKYVTWGVINVFKMDRLIAQIKKQLDGKVQEGDYILISGYAVTNGLVMNYFLQRFPEKVKLLQWEGNRDRYKIITIKDF